MKIIASALDCADHRRRPRSARQRGARRQNVLGPARAPTALNDMRADRIAVPAAVTRWRPAIRSVPRHSGEPGARLPPSAPQRLSHLGRRSRRPIRAATHRGSTMMTPWMDYLLRDLAVGFMTRLSQWAGALGPRKILLARGQTAAETAFACIGGGGRCRAHQAAGRRRRRAMHRRDRGAFARQQAPAGPVRACAQAGRALRLTPQAHPGPKPAAK